MRAIAKKYGGTHDAALIWEGHKAGRDIGYEQDQFHWNTFEFQNHLHGQSADIAVGVDADLAGHRAPG